LIVDRIENIGGHYAITLRMWRDQFLTNFDNEIAPALRKRAKIDGSQLREEDALIFKRKWEVFRILKPYNSDFSIIIHTVKRDLRARHWGT